MPYRKQWRSSVGNLIFSVQSCLCLNLQLKSVYNFCIPNIKLFSIQLPQLRMMSLLVYIVDCVHQYRNSSHPSNAANSCYTYNIMYGNQNVYSSIWIDPRAAMATAAKWILHKIIHAERLHAWAARYSIVTVLLYHADSIVLNSVLCLSMIYHWEPIALKEVDGGCWASHCLCGYNETWLAQTR